MRIFYIANNRLPTTKAHGLQIMKTCEAVFNLGHKIELIIPDRSIGGRPEGDPFEFYGIKNRFPLRKIKSRHFIFRNYQTRPFNKILFWVQQWSFARSVKKYLNYSPGDIVYSRDPFSLSAFLGSRLKLYWEAHNLPSNINKKFYKRILEGLSGVVTISEGLRKDLLPYYGEKIAVIPDGIDLEEFNISDDKRGAKLKTGLPQDKKIILYAGQLFEWKGVDVFWEASKFLSNDFLFVVVGGAEKAVEKNGDGKILFVGFRPHKDIPYYLKSADILVLPNKKDGGKSEFYTSPLKMFEYMASGRPIIASDLPSLREVLNESNAFLVKPDSPELLSEMIKRAINNPGMSDIISKKAREDVEKYTWTKRAEKILNFIR